MSRTYEVPDGLNSHTNGILTDRLAKELTMGTLGCRFRGSLICLRCPWPPRRECEWRCFTCEDRVLCKCAQDKQEIRIAGVLGLTKEGLERG